MDSVGEDGRRRRVEGLTRKSQGLEGPLCKSKKLGEAWRGSLDEAHFYLSLYLSANANGGALGLHVHIYVVLLGVVCSVPTATCQKKEMN